MSESVSKQLYEQKVRVRVCGVLIENQHILMLKHQGIGSGGYLWAPPGGGLEFGEQPDSAIVKEFREETGLEVAVDTFLFTNHYRSDRFHAVELFFSIKPIGGHLRLGSDPEVPLEEQILTEIKWLSFNEITEMDHRLIHNAFHGLQNPAKIVELSGFITFEDNSTK